MTTPTHSPIPYLRISFRTVAGGTRRVWVREVVRPRATRFRFFRTVDENGIDADPAEMIVVDPADLLTESPARVSLMYGTLEIVEVTP